jgi:hypothetical protein
MTLIIMAATLLRSSTRTLVQNKVSTLLFGGGGGGIRGLPPPPSSPFINHRCYSQIFPFVASSSSSPRYESTKAEAQLEEDLHHHDHTDDQFIDFPGGKVAFTSEMRFISDSPHKRVPCYRVLDNDGELVTHTNHVQVCHISVSMSYCTIYPGFLEYC